ncbi:unnamed protein product [Parnassius apollo]|uniref:(apollo) hypothetical protein n=1 Tax=Parnassius apollo TaxID=110799 RepID=A0A8S3WPA4_PARAO|nr:unnamed protein product [Parnassius apollo]
MPRNYIRKSLRATSYTPEDVAKAVEKVKRKELTLYGAAKFYKISIATLHIGFNKKTGVKSDTLGRPPVFDHETETRLANGLKVLEKWGFGLSRKEVILLVERYIRLNKIHTPFKDPEPDWFTNFRKRHRLSLKKAQFLEHSRKNNTNPFDYR